MSGLVIDIASFICLALIVLACIAAVALLLYLGYWVLLALITGHVYLPQPTSKRKIS